MSLWLSSMSTCMGETPLYFCSSMWTQSLSLLMMHMPSIWVIWLWDLCSSSSSIISSALLVLPDSSTFFFSRMYFAWEGVLVKRRSREKRRPESLNSWLVMRLWPYCVRRTHIYLMRFLISCASSIETWCLVASIWSLPEISDSWLNIFNCSLLVCE